jgi:signal peptidase I
MNIDFSLVLLVLSAVSGVVWLYDALFLARGRRQQLQNFLQAGRVSDDEFRQFLESQEEGRNTAAKAEVQTDPQRRKLLENAVGLAREPVPVEYAKSFFPILFGVLLLRSFLFEPFQIPTGSMIPTLNVGDFIVVNKYAYGVRLPVVGTKIIDVGEPKRGDVMVFIPPHEPNYYIKRVIGLPGDHVQYRDKVIYINGEALPQQDATLLENLGVMHSRELIGGIEHDIYTAAGERFERLYEFMPPEGFVVPAGHYFMMGDNRDNSSDSRYWGPVSEKSIVGKAVAVWMQKQPGLSLPGFSQNRLIRNPE